MLVRQLNGLLDRQYVDFERLEPALQWVAEAPIVFGYHCFEAFDNHQTDFCWTI